MKTKTLKRWKPSDVKLLRATYANAPTARVAALLGRTVDAVEGKAEKLGLKKSAALRSEQARTAVACRWDG